MRRKNSPSSADKTLPTLLFSRFLAARGVKNAGGQPAVAAQAGTSSKIKGRLSNSPIDQTWSVSPAAIAGVRG